MFHGGRPSRWRRGSRALAGASLLLALVLKSVNLGVHWVFGLSLEIDDLFCAALFFRARRLLVGPLSAL